MCCHNSAGPSPEEETFGGVIAAPHEEETRGSRSRQSMSFYPAEHRRFAEQHTFCDNRWAGVYRRDCWWAEFRANRLRARRAGIAAKLDLHIRLKTFANFKTEIKLIDMERKLTLGPQSLFLNILVFGELRSGLIVYIV